MRHYILEVQNVQSVAYTTGLWWGGGEGTWSTNVVLKTLPWKWPCTGKYKLALEV